MSIEAVTSAIGEDGLRLAVDALKEIAQDPGNEHRLSAAQTLLQYGLITDAYGNPAVG